MVSTDSIGLPVRSVRLECQTPAVSYPAPGAPGRNLLVPSDRIVALAAARSTSELVVDAPVVWLQRLPAPSSA